MNVITNHLPTSELQALDAAHHVHPFTSGADLAKKGARVITRANGVWLTDSDGNQILDGMSGLWCVNIGYGRRELADVAARQMAELPYYNTFFQTTHAARVEHRPISMPVDQGRHVAMVEFCQFLVVSLTKQRNRALQRADRKVLPIRAI